MYQKVMSAALIVSVAMAGFVLSPGIYAKSKKSKKQPVCEQTAKLMYSACKSDSRDDLNTTLANCLNILDGEESKNCQQEARAVRKEEGETCKDVRAAREDVCEILAEEIYDPDPLLDPANIFIDPDDVPGIYPPNPYVSVAAGHTYVLRAGEDGEETVIVHVTENSREIQGALCRVVVDIVVEVEEEDGEIEYTAVEVTDDWFAQDTLGNVYYCGEIARNFEDGVLRDLDGSFEAGIEFAKAGLLSRAFPVPGDVDRQEFSLGEAEDIIQYVDLNAIPETDNDNFPCAPSGCLKTLEFAPLEPESSEFKYYLPDIGFVLAVEMEDGEMTGEREELVCVGDSLAILESLACEIDDLESLLEELCKQAPEVFCEE